MTTKLSEEARQRKNDYNAEYVKMTKRAAQKKWDEANQKRKKQKIFILWLPQDQDIADHLQKIKNFSDYIKGLIRRDMGNEHEQR